MTLDLTGATVTEQTMNPFLALIRLLSDPNIAFLLFSTRLDRACWRSSTARTS